MSASRMKNLILLILTLCALGLLCIVVPNRLAQTHEQRQMLQELKTLYESCGLSVLLDELPRSPVLYSVELSEDGAQTAAQALLGAKAAPAGESGFESTYESELGTLHITRTGGFSAVMTGGSRVRSSEKAAEKLLRAMDFQYQTLTREQTETGAVQIRTSQTLARRAGARQPAGAELHGRLPHGGRGHVLYRRKLHYARVGAGGHLRR